MKNAVKINNFRWPWSRHKLICMILHNHVMNKRNALNKIIIYFPQHDQQLISGVRLFFFFFQYCAGQRFIAALSHTGGQARKN